jgi:plasmid stabilization system protein ParE
VRILYAKAARADLRAAAVYYERERPGLGREFVVEVEAAVDRISSFPRAASSGEFNTRRSPLKRFPFNIVYYTKGDALYIVAVAHKRRRPDFWWNRV